MQPGKEGKQCGECYYHEIRRIHGMKKSALIIILGILLISGLAHAEKLTVKMYHIDSKGVGAFIGTITVTSSPYGTIFTPDLSGLAPGLHGFHLHEDPSCGPAEKDGKMVPGLAAGGHYDPAHTGRHEGPYGNGHLGDLPALYVDAAGKATHPVLAPRIKIADLKGRALIIHAGGDNYSDAPEMLGGGGGRIACGTVK
jgi:Cu-Zn family superoxide dismutase